MFQNISSSYLSSYNLGGSTTVSGSNISGGLIAIYFIFVFIVAVFYIFCLWKVFVKAGKPGWAAIIPLYNLWILFEISGKPGWWSLFVFLAFIPFVGWIAIAVLEIIAMIELAKRFGKDTVFGVVLLWLFSFIGFPILAFGGAKYATSPVAKKTDDMKPQPPAIPRAPIVQ
jgi:hypothetical protein